MRAVVVRLCGDCDHQLGCQVLQLQFLALLLAARWRGAAVAAATAATDLETHFGVRAGLKGANWNEARKCVTMEKLIRERVRRREEKGKKRLDKE